MEISQNWNGRPEDGDIVRRPQPGDTLGRALRSVYGHVPLPEDMRRLIARIDCVSKQRY